MKLLPKSFTAGGFNHEQVERSGDVALYRRWKQGGGREHFEVVRIKSHDGLLYPGAKERTAPAEYYPSAEKWGTIGWTYPELEAAQRKYDELCGRITA